MVVIKEDKDLLKKDIGEHYYKKFFDFSEIIGYSIEEDDSSIKIELNPDRPDLFSFYSLKESMKTYYDNNFKLKGIINRSDISINPDNEVLNERPYLLAFEASGKKIGHFFNHIIEYQERLHDSIGKSRKKVSIGIHDMEKIRPPFVYKMEDRTKLKFTTYDNFTGTAGDIIRTHEKGIEFKSLIVSKNKVPVILDSANDVLSMPPIINGIKSKVTEETEHFFFDITGTDYNAVRNTFYLFAYEMSYLGYKISICDSGMESEKMSSLLDYDFREFNINNRVIQNITGITIDDPITLLRKMGYRCEISYKGYKVNVPGNRIDVMGPVDIVEDIAKSYGFKNIDEKQIDIYRTGNPYYKNDHIRIARDIMISINYQEVKTFVVNSKSFYDNLKYSGNVYIQNPKSLDYSVVRDSLFPGVLDLIRINKRRKLPVKIFEIGDVVVGGKQITKLCALFTDSKASYSDIFQVVNYFNKRILNRPLEIKANKHPGIIEGRGGDIQLLEKNVGIIGEANPVILEQYGIANPITFFEIDLDNFFG